MRRPPSRSWDSSGRTSMSRVRKRALRTCSRRSSGSCSVRICCGACGRWSTSRSRRSPSDIGWAVLRRFVWGGQYGNLFLLKEYACERFTEYLRQKEELNLNSPIKRKVPRQDWAVSADRSEAAPMTDPGRLGPRISPRSTRGSCKRRWGPEMW